MEVSEVLFACYNCETGHRCKPPRPDLASPHPLLSEKVHLLCFCLGQVSKFRRENTFDPDDRMHPIYDSWFQSL